MNNFLRKIIREEMELLFEAEPKTIDDKIKDKEVEKKELENKLRGDTQKHNSINPSLSKERFKKDTADKEKKFEKAKMEQGKNDIQTIEDELKALEDEKNNPQKALEKAQEDPNKPIDQDKAEAEFQQKADNILNKPI